MIDWIFDFEFTSLMGLFLYWMPAAVCAYGYAVRTISDYRRDLSDRAEKEAKGSGFYMPKLTFGLILARGLAASLPVWNLVALVGDIGPTLLSGFFEALGKAFDRPLVPERKKGGG